MFCQNKYRYFTFNFKEFLKRIYDIFFSFLGLIISLPIFITVPVMIKIDSPGHVFYFGKRTGRYNNLFFQIKFRTMVTDAEKMGSSRVSNDDFRITNIGRMLRKYKIDELPQLINILKGEMSFVGPRPDIKEYTSLYNTQESCILNLRPGLTDWATLWYRDEGEILSGFANPEQIYNEYFHNIKILLQINYLYDNSLYIDTCIIILTCISILKKNWMPKMLAERLVQIGKPAILANDMSKYIKLKI